MKKATGYISDAGNHFDNEFEAHKDDLRYRIEQACGNGPIAKSVTEAICSDLATWAGMLGHMVSLAPKQVAEQTHKTVPVDDGLPVRVDVDRYPPAPEPFVTEYAG